MDYKILQPPFTLKFREMSKKELKDYFDWFQKVLPQRLDELTKAVREVPGFDSWQPDLTPASLELLGDWFALQVEMRPRTQDEIEEIESRSVNRIEIPSEELTNRTFSCAMDIGMYLSQVFLTSYPSLRWEQSFGNKKYIDYGQPVLTGFGAAPFNPVRMLVTFAYGVASKKNSGKGLREIYDIWSKLIRV
ncbi:MAG: hypothetical protein EKK47_22650 [Burkholderiales bacterium]|nr:MAG: hypothetical protein EKK47_22650 [Burkholderiales bacterium]